MSAQFWLDLYMEGRLPPCLVNRMGSMGCSVASWWNRHQELLENTIVGLVASNPGEGRTYTHTHTSDLSLVYFAVKIKKIEISVQGIAVNGLTIPSPHETILPSCKHSLV